MIKRICCLDCGAPETVTFISRRRSCRRCALERAAAQVNRAYDLAEGIQGMPKGDLVKGIARSSAIITQAWELAQVDQAKRTEHRREVARKVGAQAPSGAAKPRLTPAQIRQKWLTNSANSATATELVNDRD